MSTNSASKIIVTTIIIAVTASGYACLEASQIRTEHVTIYSAKLPASIKRIRIVQISDVHIGLLMGEKRLGKIATKIAGAKPDILVSTGDLLDGKLSRNDRPAELDKIAALLTNIPTPYGKFAVIGNHEVYAGLAQAVEFSRKAGFNVLRNQSLKLRQSITISGVDDRMTPSLEADIINRTSKSNSNSFNLLLKHRPDIVIDSDGKFDLQLSGHVHKGQIFPFNFLVKLKHPIPCGLTTTPAGSSIYISRGTGTWGPPMRLFAPPEITIIDIVAPQLLK